MKDIDELWRLLAHDEAIIHTEHPENVWQYEAALGELLKSYWEHLLVPWWRRWLMGDEWNQVERRLRKALNHQNVWWVERHEHE